MADWLLQTIDSYVTYNILFPSLITICFLQVSITSANESDCIGDGWIPLALTDRKEGGKVILRKEKANFVE